MAVRLSTRYFDPSSKILPLIKETTDYDYTAEHSVTLDLALKKEGFITPFADQKQSQHAYYTDPTFHTLYTKTVWKETVQIITRTNAVRFVAIWESLDPEFWYHYIWKSSPEFVVPQLDMEQRKSMIKPIMAQLHVSTA